MKRFFPVLKYLNVPNVVSSVGMGFCVAACYFIVAGDIRWTYICLFVSAFLDSMDGFLAGKLNQKTRFGLYMDSLVDFFVCCVVPIWMGLVFVEHSVLMLVAAGFYCVCGLWRLSYYNVLAEDAPPFFTGLPAPSGLLLTGTTIWFVAQHGLPVWVGAAAFVLAGLLMVSAVRLKKYGLWQKALIAAGLVVFVLVMIS